MRAKPLRRVRSPRYPTRVDVLADDRLLQKHLPAAWKSRAEMVGVVAILLTANSCYSQVPDEKSASKKAGAVAPIFQHGEGRGATGCVVVNAPVFLSEQDAMQVIREELLKSGVALSESNVTLRGVSIPQHSQHWSEKNNEMVESVGPSKPLVLQTVDPQKKVGIEVVTAEDYFNLGGAQSSSTVQGFDFKAVAQAVHDSVQSKNQEIYLGTFYDPAAAQNSTPSENAQFNKKVSDLYRKQENTKDQALKKAKQAEIEALYRHRNDEMKQESLRLLRMQIKDFTDWLKAQGVI